MIASVQFLAAIHKETWDTGAQMLNGKKIFAYRIENILWMRGGRS